MTHYFLRGLENSIQNINFYHDVIFWIAAVAPSYGHESCSYAAVCCAGDTYEVCCTRYEVCCMRYAV